MSSSRGSISRFLNKPLLYSLLLIAAVVTAWVFLGPFFEFSERVLQGGLFLQLCGVAMAGLGIYRLLRDYGETLTERAVLKAGKVSVSTYGGFTVHSRGTPQVEVPVEEQLKEFEEGRAELENKLEQVENKIEEVAGELRKERKKELKKRIKEEQTKNLGLEMAGFLLMFMGVTLRFLSHLIPGEGGGSELIPARFAYRLESILPAYSAKLMERPSNFYRELERLRLRIGDLGHNLIKLVEAYHRAGAPFGETGKGLRIWAGHRQWTTPN